MLERAMLIGYLEGLYTDADLTTAFCMATTEAASVLGVERYGLAPGMRADLVAISAGSVAEAVATHPPRTLTVYAGRVVAESSGSSAAPRRDEELSSGVSSPRGCHAQRGNG
jgi:cytosine deaminase